MDDDPHEKIELNLECTVCGEREFNLCEGFYYCQECGTKHDQVRAVEVDAEAEFTDTRHIKKHKIQIIKTDKPQLTSWECYNYILRGLVEELLSFGAKEELKLMALQLWAAYLRNMEVAFFNKKHSVLPKLGPRFLKRDAQTLYNHCQEKRKKRKRRSTDDVSMLSEGSSSRVWRKTKRKLDESAYSLHSSQQSNETSFNSSSMLSSSTCTTSRAIQLKFSSNARKHLKKTMPSKHLEKHEKDGEGLLKCHNMRPKVATFNRCEYAVNVMNLKQLYAILGIALNLIEDELQLSDFVRFISEGHISSKNILQYFPENIAPNYKKILQEIEFYLYSDKYGDKALREHIGIFAKFVHIREFKAPDIFKLALRYIADLNLPHDIGMFIERLVNLMPPQMKTRVPHTYAAFEARAMAYIIFVLKLIFGLDGHKEKVMSDSARKVNEKIVELSKANKSEDDQQASLFVWQDWVEYVEMRKVIVSHYNTSFSTQFKQCQSTAQMLEELSEDQRHQLEQNAAEEGGTTTNSKVMNMQHIFEKFQNNYEDSELPERPESIKFSPTFTPAHTYFKRILLHYKTSNENSSKFNIPEFMHVDHTQSTLQPFIRAKKLSKHFREHGWSLKVCPTLCTTNRCYVGVFRMPKSNIPRKEGALEADFDVSESEWMEKLVVEPVGHELEFKTKLDEYEKDYMKKLQRDHMKRTQRENEDMPQWLLSSQKRLQERLKTENVSSRYQSVPPTNMCENVSQRQDNQCDVLSQFSFDVFGEDNMNPVENVQFEGPRRGLDNVCLFDELSDDDDEDDGAIGNDDSSVPISLVTSKMDLWMLLGSMNGLTGIQKKILENKFPRSFSWLLETCAQTIGVEWGVVYEQLLAIEVMFGYGIEKLDAFEDCIRYKYNNPIKDFNMLVNAYREIW